MASWRPKRCRVCGARRDDGIQISKQGLCWTHSLAATRDAVVQMATRSGPLYDRYRASRGLPAMTDAEGGVVGIPPPVVKPASIERAARVQA